MLRSRGDFASLQRVGRSRGSQLLVVRWAPNGLDRTRFGLSTGRRLGGSVVRNRTRRRLRVVLRNLAPRIGPGWDILVAARPGAEEAALVQLAVSMERILRGAGILTREGSDA